MGFIAPIGWPYKVDVEAMVVMYNINIAASGNIGRKTLGLGGNKVGFITTEGVPYQANFLPVYC